MRDLTVIKTRFATYECERASINGGKIYFNGMAVNLSTVDSIVKNGKEIYHA